MQTVIADTPNEPFPHPSAFVRRHDDGGGAELLRALAHHLADGPRVEISAGHLDDKTNAAEGRSCGANLRPTNASALRLSSA